MHAASQARHPWRATLRTAFAYLVAFAAVWPTLVELVGLSSTWQWVSVSVAVAAAITRIMADPRVVAFTGRFVPWLAPEPPAGRRDASTSAADDGSEGA